MKIVHTIAELREAVAAGDLQILQQNTFLSLALSGVVKALEHAANVLVALAVVTRLCELNLGAAIEKLLDLFNCTKPCFVHVDHHPCNDQPTSLNRPQIPRFRLIPRWKYGFRSGSYHIG